MINLDYKDGRSLHEQIEGGIRELIIGGVLAPDEQLPSVRELSVSLTVNPNTVQRAYKQLETDGYIYSIKGKGNFVSPVPESSDPVRKSDLYANLRTVVQELMYLGEEMSDINNVIFDIYNKKEDAK